MIDTRSRLPGWTEGRWLTLGDGQSWCLPKLSFTRKVTTRPNGAAIVAECDHDVDVLAHFELIRGEPGWEARIRAYQHMFSRLIRANYDMTEAEADSLLDFGFDGGDPDSGKALLEEVLAVFRETVIDPVSSLVEQGGATPGDN